MLNIAVNQETGEIIDLQSLSNEELIKGFRYVTSNYPMLKNENGYDRVVDLMIDEMTKRNLDKSKIYH